MCNRCRKKWILTMTGTVLLGLAIGVAVFKSKQEVSADYWSEYDKRDVPDIRKLARSAKKEDRDQARKLGQDYDALFAEVMARYPELEPAWKEVSDENNGFLQWLEFSDRYAQKIGPSDHGGYADFDLPDPLSDMMNGLVPWNADGMSKHLEAYQTLIEEVTRIGLLTGQSTAGIPVDRWVMTEASIAKTCADLLCVDARLAAERGDNEKARTRLQAALGLAKHFSSVETPSLLMETVAILVQLTVYETSMQHVLPDLQLNAKELRAWRHDFKPVTNSNFTRVMRGEFYAGMRGLLIPVVLAPKAHPKDPEIPDPDALCYYFAEQRIHEIKQIQPAGYADLYQNIERSSQRVEPSIPISKGARMMFDAAYTGWGAMLQGYARAEAIYRYHDAALAIASGDQAPVELLTGKPFLFDEETRELRFPDDPMLEDLNANLIKVP